MLNQLITGTVGIEFSNNTGPVKLSNVIRMYMGLKS